MVDNPETGEQGRGQLVTAAINVTRAFSQFLGAALQVINYHYIFIIIVHVSTYIQT